MKNTTILATAAALLVLPSAALASTSTSENISVCKAEIESQLAPSVSETDLEFRTVKGNSRVQTLAFRIDADGEKDQVKCKVRRDDTVEVVWGKTVKPEVTQTAEVKDETKTSE